MALSSPSNSSSSLPAGRRRRAVTDLERQTIRKRNREHPPARQSELIAWFEQDTGHKLNQSQISKIISKQFEHLDSTDTKKTKSQLEAKRTSAGDWPDLEGALFEWQQHIQKQKAVITGEILRNQAGKLWDSLPQYRGKEKPRFSNGWLEGFKRRFKIKEYILHGEAASAEVENLNAIEHMERIRSLASEYKPCNVLNMDETALFWKLTPDRTLATKAGSGGKKSKDRITLALTCNADGSEKFEPWIIGKSKNPRCLKGINCKLLRIQYRWNKSKWMTGLIMQEYLIWLDNKMRAQDRKVLLLIDNFSGHELGVQLVGQSLTNVRAEWFPPNTTSHWQPMDQGIIASFKLQYRRLWVAYMLRQYEAGKDPNKTVTLLKAIQWTRVAWTDIVTTATIQKCWWKSTVVKKPVGQEIVEDTQQPDQDELQAQIQELPGIADRLSINEFIQPAGEVVDDDDQDIFASVVERYSIENEGTVEEVEEGDSEIENIRTAEALKALETVRLWELQQEDGQASTLQVLDRVERRMQLARKEGRKQTTIVSFF